MFSEYCQTLKWSRNSKVSFLRSVAKCQITDLLTCNTKQCHDKLIILFFWGGGVVLFAISFALFMTKKMCLIPCYVLVWNYRYLGKRTVLFFSQSLDTCTFANLITFPGAWHIWQIKLMFWIRIPKLQEAKTNIIAPHDML